MAEDQSFQELLGFVDAALAPDADVSAAEVQGRLGDAMPDFLNLLQQKVLGRSADAHPCQSSHLETTTAQLL